MMHLLQPIALDILRRLTQLFDLYLYIVHAFFANDKVDLLFILPVKSNVVSIACV
jgi:hypothetical protein